MLNDKKIEKIQVDKDILDFLKAIYFGDFSDPLKAASSRAYRDMNRTIRFLGLPDETRLDLREEVNRIFKEEIVKLSSNVITSQDSFDSWHRSVSDRIKRTYSKQEINLTYGHAQKWINMTIKYLYILEANVFEGVFNYLHIPLDNYVFDIARDSLGIDRPTTAWSSWDYYEEQYLTYQKEIRQKVREESPLRWEFRYWLKAARNIESHK